ncbi:hypothetical protein Tsubulata_017023 [Turnera subulata]|uniref:Pentacotripeptide-repeat region of PRORP domain-containing protein n=1 Tax=Turnera subulata TaxID=218843 RepID=A0A9Q0FFK6_9ROSI|nr:hypothetical protein Tsubulata_017023 [Turnera subulata]
MKLFHKFIQTAAIISPEQKTNTILKLPQRSNLYLAPTSLLFSDILTRCSASKALAPGTQIHAHAIQLGLGLGRKLRNCLIVVYSKCRSFGYARKLVDESPEPDLVSWSSLISGYAQNGLAEEALFAFHEMHLLGVKCNEFTFPSVLKACTVTKDLGLGRQVHGSALVTGFVNDEFVANSLVVFYAKCGEFGDSRRVFDAMPQKSVVSWNGLLACYVQDDSCGEAIGLFEDMIFSGVRPNEFTLSSLINACTGLEDCGQGRKVHGFLIKLGYGDDPFSKNALVDMYAKVGTLEDSIAIFHEIARPDIVSWNAVIAACVSHEDYNSALQLFRRMYGSGVHPNMFTFSSALKDSHACSQIHALSLKLGIESQDYVANSLIDTYGKCDLVEKAARVFKESPVVDLVAFTSLITAYSQDGQGEEALKLYLAMWDRGIKPDPFDLGFHSSVGGGKVKGPDRKSGRPT